MELYLHLKGNFQTFQAAGQNKDTKAISFQKRYWKIRIFREISHALPE